MTSSVLVNNQDKGLVSILKVVKHFGREPKENNIAWSRLELLSRYASYMTEEESMQTSANLRRFNDVARDVKRTNDFFRLLRQQAIFSYIMKLNTMGLVINSELYNLFFLFYSNTRSLRLLTFLTAFLIFSVYFSNTMSGTKSADTYDLLTLKYKDHEK